MANRITADVEGALRQGLAIGVGVLAIAALSIIAAAVAAVGAVSLLIASAWMLGRRRLRPARPATRMLDAHKTPDGWIVETFRP